MENFSSFPVHFSQNENETGLLNLTLDGRFTAVGGGGGGSTTVVNDGHNSFILLSSPLPFSILLPHSLPRFGPPS